MRTYVSHPTDDWNYTAGTYNATTEDRPMSRWIVTGLLCLLLAAWWATREDRV